MILKLGTSLIFARHRNNSPPTYTLKNKIKIIQLRREENQVHSELYAFEFLDK